MCYNFFLKIYYNTSIFLTLLNNLTSHCLPYLWTLGSFGLVFFFFPIINGTGVSFLRDKSLDASFPKDSIWFP